MIKIIFIRNYAADRPSQISLKPNVLLESTIVPPETIALRLHVLFLSSVYRARSEAGGFVFFVLPEQRQGLRSPEGGRAAARDHLK